MKVSSKFLEKQFRFIAVFYVKYADIIKRIILYMIKVLLVEDEAPIQEMVSFTLSMREIEVKCVSDVSSALVALADSNSNFSCIIIDWMLPDKSGISLVKKIRSDSTLKKLPIIMLTAKADEKNKLKGFEVGVDDYITKPFSPKELHARILALLNRSEM